LPVHSRQSFENSRPSSVSPTYARAKLGERYLQRARRASAGLCVCVCAAESQLHYCVHESCYLCACYQRTKCFLAAIGQSIREACYSTHSSSGFPRTIAQIIVITILLRQYDRRLSASQFFRIIFRERKWWSSCCGNMIEDRQSRNLVRVIVREKKMRKNTNGKRYSTSSSSELSRTIAEIIVIILLQQYDRRSSVSQSSLSE
jgi:hypothetical protein